MILITIPICSYNALLARCDTSRPEYEIEDLLKRKADLQKKYRGRAKILPISTPLMDGYIREVQRRLQQKRLATRRNFSERFEGSESPWKSSETDV